MSTKEQQKNDFSLNDNNTYTFPQNEDFLGCRFYSKK